MKKIQFLLSFMLISLIASAQQNVKFNINHKLANSSFAFNQTTSNDLGDNFNFDRFEYYLSEIKLIHDGGQISSVANTWVLVDASQTTSIDLGSFPITSLEGIRFSVGVETPANHNDPSLYSGNHPLSPKSPSMHWGWAAGYRFAAIEGKTGTSMNQIWQIHALGDANYRTQTVTTSGYLQNGDLIVSIDADYSSALNGIAVNGNLLYHGEQNEAATCLSNFQSQVFSQTSVGLFEFNQENSFGISPNPSNETIFVNFEKLPKNAQYNILDNSGKLIQEGAISDVNQAIQIDKNGLFFFNVYQNGELLGSRKIILK